jgi:hypothetical protein
VEAGDLRVGDVLLLRSGLQEPITRLETRHGAETVYNFHVQGLHCYAVGNPQVLVHNKWAPTPALRLAGALVPSGRRPAGARALGVWGEARLAQVLGGLGVKPGKCFKTSIGCRYFDRIVGGIAHEAKAGINVRLTPKIRRQILKDRELVRSGFIKGAHWHFFQGADKELLRFLRRHRIRFTVYHP